MGVGGCCWEQCCGNPDLYPEPLKGAAHLESEHTVAEDAEAELRTVGALDPAHSGGEGPLAAQRRTDHADGEVDVDAQR